MRDNKGNEDNDQYVLLRKTMKTKNFFIYILSVLFFFSFLFFPFFNFMELLGYLEKLNAGIFTVK